MRRLSFDSLYDRGPAHECWLWKGATSKGYGRLGRISAHRHAWELVNGPIPEGLTIDHICRMTSCVNPSHLRVLTNEENARMNGNWIKTHCVHGHEFTPETTYWTRQGHRTCRVCSGKVAKGSRPPRTECSNGHPLSGDNLVARGCRICKNARLAESRQTPEARAANTEYMRAYRAAKKQADAVKRGGDV